MRIEINNILVSLNHNIEEVVNLAVKKIGIKKSDVKGHTITRRSVDARRNNIRFNYCIVLDVNDKIKPNSNTKILADVVRKELKIGSERLNNRPVIIGAGPAGLFAAYVLAKNGYKPLVIERGGTVQERTGSIGKFIATKTLNAESNIQFGEGGAGTFSDGKLTTRIDDERCNTVLEIFAKFGAPSDILYLAKPHIGTDKLREIIINIRNEITILGGEFHFNKKFEDFTITNSLLSSAIINKEQIPCKALILAIGHSARDTYEMLHKKTVAMSPKAFAIGVRVEHLQSFINTSQYGDFADHPMLGMAEYRLAYNGLDRSCFSFCMCPGGSVVAATSEENGVVVNGMSNYARDGVNANSALVVNVRTDDYDGVLGGIDFQRKYEKLAYSLTKNYSAPVQCTADFLSDVKSTNFKGVTPTYPAGYEFCRLDDCLPDFVSKTLRDGIRYFDSRIKNFSASSVLTGVETRTSAPVRILRDENLESINVKGLYPVGEGAGYAGGIMSAAVDGIKVAEKIIEKYSPNNL